MAADDASPASAVRERYERMFREQQRGSKGAALGGDPAAAALTAQGQAVRTAFQGGISSVFTKHLRQAIWSLQSAVDAASLAPVLPRCLSGVCCPFIEHNGMNDASLGYLLLQQLGRLSPDADITQVLVCCTRPLCWPGHRSEKNSSA